MTEQVPIRRAPAVFLSPLKAQKGPAKRVRKVSMRMMTVGETAVMTLSYPDLASAKAARAALIAAGNVHAVPSASLWRAICEAFQAVSLKVPE